MNYSNIMVLDFETGGKNPHTCEPIQLAAVILEPIKLEIVDEFQSMMRALKPDELEEKALEVNKKTKEEIAAAPHPKQVWLDFCNFAKKYTKKNFYAPILAGYNILSFDKVILDRLAKEYGGWNEKENKNEVYNSFAIIDLMQHIWLLTENSKVLPNIKLSPTLLDHVGLYSDDAHDALVDVKNTSKLLVRLIKYFRKLDWANKSKGCFIEEKNV